MMIEQMVRKALARLMNFWYLEDLLPHVPKLSLLAPRTRAMIIFVSYDPGKYLQRLG